MTVEDFVAAPRGGHGERDQHLADLQRVSAEFQNFRKQTEKRNRTSQPRPARESPRRSCRCSMRDAAAQQGVEGVEPIAGQLRVSSERAGQVIAELDAPFDPNLHEAAMSEPATMVRTA